MVDKEQIQRINIAIKKYERRMDDIAVSRRMLENAEHNLYQDLRGEIVRLTGEDNEC